MYTDTILFLISGLCAVIAIIFAIYLIVSQKRSKVYRAVLQQETELFDALTTTTLLMKSTKPITSISTGNEQLIGKKAAPERGTQLLIADDETELLQESTDAPVIVDFDASALEGRYVLEEEIHGGGMSRVFLARSAKLGNKWIVKFISNQTGELANEENILKLLNHISLPKIIDIFHDNKGVYLVESFIEGVSLDKVLETGQKLNQVIILEWAEQLTQVLAYLHMLEPHPIFHFDLKPSNIMVTHDNRLVLIDFGISKRFGEDDKTAVGVTYNYAAPEQLKHRIPEKYQPMIATRFGELPADRLYWSPDARTDIFSLGVILFELAVGQIPTEHNANLLKDAVSNELYEIIKKCLALNPSDRYQSAKELLEDLQKNKGTKVKMARTLFIRKLAALTAAISMVVSACSLGGGYYVYGQENMALLDVDPEMITLSLQQSSDLKVEKQMPDGAIVLLEPQRIRWTFDQNNIAQIDGNRIVGMNIGKAELSGQYRNKNITLKINVVKPMKGMVDIVQRYQPGHLLEAYLGTTERDHIDGSFEEAEFVSPESIDISDDGTIYITDAGVLRKIKEGQVESIKFEPDYLTSRMVCCYKNEVYVLTNEWEDEEGVYYGIIRIIDGGAEGLYMADAKYTAVEDFEFSIDGLIYFIDRNEGTGQTCLKTLNPRKVEDINTLCELPKGTSALTMDDTGRVYLANPETGVLQVYANSELKYFSGVENEKAFIDGTAPLYYEPQRIKYVKDMLYVWDFNTLRRLDIKDGIAGECITIAGEASPEFDMKVPEGKQNAEEIILPNSKLIDFAVYEESILLTDSKRGVLWRVE